jgi:hypothetical protein
MKKIILLGIAVLPVICLAQSNTTQLPNGVIVHRAEGVEKTVEPVINHPVKTRTIQDWNLAECIDALNQVEMKLENAPGSDRERYLAAKAQIVDRINELKSGN